MRAMRWATAWWRDWGAGDRASRERDRFSKRAGHGAEAEGEDEGALEGHGDLEDREARAGATEEHLRADLGALDGERGEARAAEAGGREERA